jgi:hypothetical protein
MKKNIDEREAQLRTLAGVLLLLFALFLENSTLRILFAMSAAILAGTSFLRTCLLYTLLGKKISEQQQVLTDTQTKEENTEEGSAVISNSTEDTKNEEGKI